MQRFSAGRENARTVGAQTLLLGNEAKLDHEPVEAGQGRELSSLFCLEAEMAVGFEEARVVRIRQQGDVAEEVVENVRLHDVVELVRPPDPLGYREATLGQQSEELSVRQQPRAGNKAPARRILEDVGRIRSTGTASSHRRRSRPLSQAEAARRG